MRARREVTVSDSPFVISTRELGRQPGSMETVEISVSSEHDLGNQVIGISAGSPMELDLRLESVMDGVLVTGTVRGEATGECVRCLRPVAAEVAVDLTELFVHHGTEHPGSEEFGEDEELPQIHADTVNLEPAVIDAVVTSLPLRPLCDPACPGLCPDCGIRLDEAEPGHGHDRTDPRWDALAALVGSLEESDDDDGDRQ